MIEIKSHSVTNVAVVCPVVKNTTSSLNFIDPIERENEAVGLVLAMGQTVVFSETVKLSSIVPKSFFGKGTLDRLKEKFNELNVELLVVDASVSAVQQRNLEKILNLKVIDRTAVILEIFGQRAHTKEGKLQVELAHLTYQRGRLVRSWTHLERQRGGGGFLGGPGETQIELDRRHIDERIIKIKKELEKVRQTRTIQRNARVKVPFPVAALVGYTNAGKSTLFNFITQSHVFAKDMLFATLDPTMRKVQLAKGVDIILSDTVGFISNLPHELIMAFRATLEEVLEADVIIHVIDVANPDYKSQRQNVLNVLHELGLDKIEFSPNYIEVFNKIDLLVDPDKSQFLQKYCANTVALSALSGDGVNDLILLLKDKFNKKAHIHTVSVPLTDGKKLAEIYRNFDVLERKNLDDCILLKIRQIV